jgi:hypothetical protein
MITIYHNISIQMQNLIQKCVYNYLTISHHFQSNYDHHYPKELIQYIIGIYYHSLKTDIVSQFLGYKYIGDSEIYKKYLCNTCSCLVCSEKEKYVCENCQSTDVFPFYTLIRTSNTTNILKSQS